MIPSRYPVPEDQRGLVRPVACPDCGLAGDTEVPFATESGIPLADCPACDGAMVWNPSGGGFNFAMKGHGFSETKCGMRRNRDMTRENERRGKTQWDRVEPLKGSEGTVARNPTPGGPLDPHGPFAKKTTNRVIVT